MQTCGYIDEFNKLVHGDPSIKNEQTFCKALIEVP